MTESITVSPPKAWHIEGGVVVKCPMLSAIVDSSKKLTPAGERTLQSLAELLRVIAGSLRTINNIRDELGLRVALIGLAGELRCEERAIVMRVVADTYIPDEEVAVRQEENQTPVVP